MRYPFTIWAIIDLISILPTLTILSPGFKLLRLFRIFRTFRVFRVLKAFRYSKNIEIICGEKAVVKNLREVSGESDAEEVVSSLYQYQIYFLEHGLRSIKADIRFYEGILKKELEG